jgi:hypothetical protein
MVAIRVVTILVGLAIAAFVALSPNVAYAPTPRIILYLLTSLIPAILFAGEVSTRLQLRLPGLVFTATGTAAFTLTTLIILTHYSKPEAQIAVFHVVDENDDRVPLDWQGAVETPVSGTGIGVTRFVDGNALVLIFPEQLPEVELRVKRTSGGRPCVGTVGYAGTRQYKLVLGRDLRCS